MKKLTVLSFSLILLFAIGLTEVSEAAATASLTVLPSTGTYNTGQIFTINIQTEGGGRQFNVAEAKVSVSSNLKVQDVVFGDCNFAFVKTPDVNKLDFVGGILGGESTKCTVLTAQIKALSSGTGTIVLTDTKLKTYPDSQELSPVTIPGQFIINQSGSQQTANTSTASDQTVATVTSPPINGQYSVAVKVVTEDNKPIVGAKVALNIPQVSTGRTSHVPNQTTPIETQVATTDDKGIANFSGVPAGAYKIVAKKGHDELADKILTVNGNNGTIQIGVKGTSSSNPMIIQLVLVMILIITMIALVFFRKKLLSIFKPKAAK